ncbi:uncharacterized protein FA14DRAFT_185031 [Meira miltonrushii]|uniref:Uncharacterized protein n=1 Tax=Meira miltonrushii TaxID=1280837 RepID=A0A316V7K6_9BASI|nr:uncharacterized protein FA14DRAFT_185031 [Meira miltonrushii]PWN33174.1 hypothetical protein FA14DRAFT_185031 [Meira miltonrushii]
MTAMLSTHTFLCFSLIFVALNIFIGIADCAPGQNALHKKTTLNRSGSLRSQFLQDIRPKGDLSSFSSESREQIKHIYEKRPDSPRKARVHPDDQEKYAHLRQQEQTFGRIGKIGKETIGNAQGDDKKVVYIGGGLSSHFSKHAGREADKLIRPLSPVKAGNKKH